MSNNKTSRFFMAVPACIIVALLLSGYTVASDYLMEALMLVRTPDKLIYVVGEGDELILNGGRMIRRDYTSNDNHTLIRLDEFDYDIYGDKYFHENVDFSKKWNIPDYYCKKTVVFLEILLSIYRASYFPRGVCNQRNHTGR